jgi:hypothetical protein
MPSGKRSPPTPWIAQGASSATTPASSRPLYRGLDCSLDFYRTLHQLLTASLLGRPPPARRVAQAKQHGRLIGVCTHLARSTNFAYDFWQPRPRARSTLW